MWSGDTATDPARNNTSLWSGSRTAPACRRIAHTGKWAYLGADYASYHYWWLVSRYIYARGKHTVRRFCRRSTVTLTWIASSVRWFCSLATTVVTRESARTATGVLAWAVAWSHPSTIADWLSASPDPALFWGTTKGGIACIVAR